MNTTPVKIETTAEFLAFQAGVTYAKDMGKDRRDATNASGRYEEWEHFCEGFHFQRSVM